MHIADNILKHHLKNVLFISGTAYGGKTTMARLLEEKHGLLRYSEEEYWDEHRACADPDDQPAMCYQRRDWESFFNRPPDQYAAWLRASIAEKAEMELVDLITLSQDRTIVADVLFPLELLRRVADYHQVILLVAPVEMLVEEFFQRDDKQAMLECILSTSDPQRTLANVKETLRKEALPVEAFRGSGFKCLVRDGKTSVEETFREVERHFGLA
jgi:hypothetical protein